MIKRRGQKEFPPRVSGIALIVRVRNLVRVQLLFLYQEEPDLVAQVGIPPCEGFQVRPTGHPGHPEEDPGHALGIILSAEMGTPRDSPEELAQVAGRDKPGRPSSGCCLCDPGPD